MNEVYWLSYDDPLRMIDFLAARRIAGPPPEWDSYFRKMRLFACAASEARAYVDRKMGSRQLADAVERAYVMADNPPFISPFPRCDGIIDPSPSDAARWAVNMDAAPEFQAGLLRCLFGNPFQAIPCTPLCSLHGGVAFPGSGWCCWQTPLARSLALNAYQQRHFEALPILADALEEAGCNLAEVLTHLRGPGPHARGCFALDLVLGRE